MTDLPNSDLSNRLLAAVLVRDSDLASAASMLRRLGMPVQEIAAVVAGLGLPEGASQRQIVENLADLGFEAGDIVIVTGFAKASVGPVVSRYKASKAPSQNRADGRQRRGRSTKSEPVLPAS